MSAEVMNHVPGMLENQGKILRSFGKDSTQSIIYNFNHQGFRGTHNFDFVPDYAFFGCSLVFGIGVDQDKTFPYLFNKSHNYGLAGSYDNHDVMSVLKQFLQSELYNNRTKITVCWHRRDEECLDNFYSDLVNYNIIHWYCGKVLPYENCYRVPRNLDYDVSGTHYGTKTHYFFWKILNCIFHQ